MFFACDPLIPADPTGAILGSFAKLSQMITIHETILAMRKSIRWFASMGRYIAVVYDELLTPHAFQKL